MTSLGRESNLLGDVCDKIVVLSCYDNLNGICGFLVVGLAETIDFNCSHFVILNIFHASFRER